MTRSCLAAVIGACAITICGMTNVAHSQTWTLGRAIDHGLQHAPRVKAAASQVEAATLRSQGGKLTYYPSLDVTATHGIGRYLPADGSSPFQSSTNITVSQLIYDFGLTKSSQRSLDADTQRTTLAAALTREQFILDVALAYYRLAQAKRNEATTKDRLKVVERQQSSLKRQVQQGFRTPRDLTRLDALVQRGRSTLTASQSRIQIATIELARLIGLDQTPTPDEFAALVPENEAPPFPQLPPIKETLAAKLADLEQKQADLAIDVLKHKHAPQLRLAADAGYSASDYMGTGYPLYERDRLGVSAALSLQYALWDGGRKKNELATALADKATGEAARDDNLAELNQTLQSLEIEKDQRRAAFEAAQKLLALEQDNYAHQEKAYREGKSSYLDLVTAIDNLGAARSEYDSTYFALLELKARYHFYQGTTYGALAR